MVLDNDRERIEALLKEATPEAATGLAALERQSDSKEVRKAARRALYLLSTRGVRPIAELMPEAVLPDVLTKETVRAYASGYDGAGNRILFFELAGPDGGKPTAVQIMFGPLGGLESCDSSRMSARDLRHRIQQIEELQSQGLAFVEITADYGRWLLAEARELLRRQNKPSPAGVLELLPRIGVAKRDYLVSPVYDSITVETLRSDASVDHDPAVFFALSWFENWFFNVEEVFAALKDWENAVDTSDASANDKSAAQRDLIVRELATELFLPGVRSRYVRRLEDTADILWRLSLEVDAKLALFHAQELAADIPIADVPFARALVERTLHVGVAILNEQRAETTRQG